MTFSSVLFDLDGTILDTADDLGAALNFVLAKHGKTAVSADCYTPEASNGSKGLLKLGFGEAFIGYDFEVLKAELLQYYCANIAVHTDFFAGVTDALNHLNQNNIPWGIVTNKPAFLTEPLLTHYPEFAHCRTVVSGDTLKVAKPSPEPLLYGLNEMDASFAQGCPASGCLYVGDALRDIEAGRNAGMKTAAALYGYIADGDDVDSWGADYHFDSLLELVELM
ncbi:MAG: 2-phosphoglycolate phosphatase [Phenylobacterium sp.]|jgi:2-phosphoglycolate phosphatase